MEDKELICSLLLDTLKATREYNDLKSLTYHKTYIGDEIVIAEFTNGASKMINVTMDSGKALIYDVVSVLGGYK